MSSSPAPLHKFESADAAGARLAKLDLGDAARLLAAASGAVHSLSSSPEHFSSPPHHTLAPR
jgi:hypothetical protein